MRQFGIYDKPQLRKTVEGILYRMRTGLPWRDLPSFFGKWISASVARISLRSMRATLAHPPPWGAGPPPAPPP